MLGHVFVVEDAKDLAQIVRDVTRYGGSYRPEVRVVARMRGQVAHARGGAGRVRVYTAPVGLEKD